jgi:hypothetical protein
MKIYLASSWKNYQHLVVLQELLESHGHEVDCFANGKNGRFSFNWAELIHNALGCETKEEALKILQSLDAKDMMSNPTVLKAFDEDRKMIEWADVVILILPSGKSSHLEAGYGKGIGKKLFILGDFEKGEFETMYGFADGLFRDDYDIPDLLAKLGGKGE